MRFLPQEVASMRAGRWQGKLGLALHGRTLGNFGYGHIGSLVATYGRAFGMRVLAWGREGSRARARADGIEGAASRDALFRDADVLRLHLGTSHIQKPQACATALSARQWGHTCSGCCRRFTVVLAGMSCSKIMQKAQAPTLRMDVKSSQYEGIAHSSPQNQKPSLG